MNPLAFLEHSGDPLRVVATAVTPVVMVSATAILISGVNARYASIADRVRNLAHEYRGEPPDSARRRTIRREMPVFMSRLHLASWAARILYASVGCFIAVALLIGLTTWNQTMQAVTLPLFLLGLALDVLAIVLELVELQESNRTITFEAEDVLQDRSQGK